MPTLPEERLAVWAITANGARLAQELVDRLPGAEVFVAQQIQRSMPAARRFGGLSAALAQQFGQYAGHIFIMSTGIVVRLIAPLMRSKITDPAVVVLDEQARHAVSLLSGHLGGANDLTRRVARITGAAAVITTATDVSGKPAIDVLAQARRLYIENPAAIKTVNMALLEDRPIYLHDPREMLGGRLPNAVAWPQVSHAGLRLPAAGERARHLIPGVFIDDIQLDLPRQILVLRPPTLVAGIGCNRHTAMTEIKHLLEETLARFHLAIKSLQSLASISLKAGEAGLLALAGDLGVALQFFERRQLQQVENIKTPSAMVEKHVGVKSVCEAAAILAARNGPLVVPKQTTGNVTVAVARIGSMSWASDPAARST